LLVTVEITLRFSRLALTRNTEFALLEHSHGREHRLSATRFHCPSESPRLLASRAWQSQGTVRLAIYPPPPAIAHRFLQLKLQTEILQQFRDALNMLKATRRPWDFKGEALARDWQRSFWNYVFWRAQKDFGVRPYLPPQLVGAKSFVQNS
jgi:hypothetical protein